MRLLTFIIVTFLFSRTQAGELSSADSLAFNPYLNEDNNASINTSSPQWKLRVVGGRGTVNSLGEIFTLNDISDVEGSHTYGADLGYLIKENLWDKPLDVYLNLGLLAQQGGPGQKSHTYTSNLYLQFEWKQFPWNDKLRTKFSVGQGISYSDHITWSEQNRREFKPSKHLLNYLDFALNLHSQDLLRALHLPSGSSKLDKTWLTLSLHHRSGAFGLYGDYTDSSGDKRAVTGGDNILSLGLTLEL